MVLSLLVGVWLLFTYKTIVAQVTAKVKHFDDQFRKLVARVEDDRQAST
jgi:hypothetical protein